MNQLVPIPRQLRLPATQLAEDPLRGAGPEDGQALRDFIALFRRRFVTFCATVAAVGSVLMILQMSQPRMYTATASVMIDGRARDVVDDQTAVVSALPNDAAAIDTETQVLASRGLAERLVAAENLLADPEFNAAARKPQPGLFNLFGLLGAKRSGQPSEAQRDATVDAVSNRMKARRVGETRVIEISFKSQDPVKSARLADAVVEQYLLGQLDTKYDATRRANFWLEERLGSLRREVQEAEGAVEQYRAQAGLLSTAGSTAPEQQLAELQSQLVLANADIAEREARLRRMRAQFNSGGIDSLAEVQASQTIQDLRSQEGEVVRRLGELREKYGPQWPARQQAETELADLREEIRRQERRVLATIEQEANISRERASVLEANIAAMRGELASGNVANVRLRELERTAEASREVYEQFLQRYKETREQEGFATPDAQLVSGAAPPRRHSEPRGSIALALSLIAGCVVGLILVVILELMESGYRTSKQIEGETGLTHLGLVPKVHKVRPAPFSWRDPQPPPAEVAALPAWRRSLWRLNRLRERALGYAKTYITAPAAKPAEYVIEKPLSSYAEAMRTLRATIMLARREQPKSVLLTSAVANEGKSVTVLSLARISAMSGAKVIAIDCDLRRKGLTQLAGLAPEIGLLEVIQGEKRVEDAIVRDSRSALDLLPLSGAAAPTEEVFSLPSMGALLDALRDRYDLILIDSAPVLLVADTRVLTGLSDSVVLLSQWRRTPRGLVRAAASALQAAHAPVVGCALTQVDTQAVRLYADGEMGAYYKAYNSYYVE